MIVLPSRLRIVNIYELYTLTARLANDQGLDTTGIQDYLYDGSLLDTWTLLTTLAVSTDKVRFFTNVTHLHYVRLLSSQGPLIHYLMSLAEFAMKANSEPVCINAATSGLRNPRNARATPIASILIVP